MPASPRPANTRRVEINMPVELYDALQKRRKLTREPLSSLILRCLVNTFPEAQDAVERQIETNEANAEAHLQPYRETLADMPQMLARLEETHYASW